jgi:hypothetical protein
MTVDTSKWSGEGTFTQAVIDWLRHVSGVAGVRVEDAPASRSEADYNFMSNEIFVLFRTREVEEPVRRLGVFPGTRKVAQKVMTLNELEQAMAAAPEIGPPDYADAGMLQYLRTERIVPPYQTHGYKLVELVRIYEAIATPASDRH